MHSFPQPLALHLIVEDAYASPRLVCVVAVKVNPNNLHKGAFA